MKVPDVVGMSKAEAKAALELAGFVVEVIEQHVSDTGNVGIVLDQDPAGGTKMLQGTTVTITVGSTDDGSESPSPDPSPDPPGP